MTLYNFETVDVFGETRFSGNPLAVFTDALGMATAEMQALASEMNLSETAFVLPPKNCKNTAHVRIFNRTAEMAFAGHPLIGTAYVLARNGRCQGESVMLETRAGLVRAQVDADTAGRFHGATIWSPQALRLGNELSPKVIAECLGLDESQIVLDRHHPVEASVGNPYVIVELEAGALSRCAPQLGAFRRALQAYPNETGRFSIHAYAGWSGQIRARMFAPLAGTIEDPATGSANAPLAGLLLSLGNEEEATYQIHQGVEMGRPSLLTVSAYRSACGIWTKVAGHCVPVFRGTAIIGEPDFPQSAEQKNLMRMSGGRSEAPGIFKISEGDPGRSTERARTERAGSRIRLKSEL